jgi:hypothetical protein
MKSGGINTAVLVCRQRQFRARRKDSAEIPSSAQKK